MKGSHIVLGVTGSIAAFKAAELTGKLVKADAEVTVVMTESARRFVAPLTFETLSHRPVLTDMWSRPPVAEPVHIALAEWADALVVAPATADFIGKLANGIADDLLSCTAISIEKPSVIAPAMNDVMYRHPAVQQNVALLEKRGCILVGPVRGRLASGKVGMGRMAELDDILRAVRSVFGKKSTRKGKTRAKKARK